MTMCLGASVAENSSRILIWSGVLLLLLIGLSAGVWYYRRRWLSSDETSSTSWTLDDIRRLRDEGTLTAAEYQALRATMIGAYTAGAAKSDSSASPAGLGASGKSDQDFDLEKGPPG